MKQRQHWFKNESNAPSSLMETTASLPVIPSPSTLFGPLAPLYHDMEQMLSQTMRNLGFPVITGGGLMRNMMFMPNIDIASTDREYLVEVEVPGLKEQDIRVDVTRHGELCICGEKRMENDNQDKDFHRVERAYGSFSRTIDLPEDVDQERIEAHFENGILTIVLPRLESKASNARRVEVNGQGRPRRPRQDNERQESRGGQPQAGPKRVA